VGQIAVNLYPFSDKPVEIPSAGAEAKEGDLLVIEIDDSGKLEWGPAMTPLGKREFVGTCISHYVSSIIFMGTLIWAKTGYLGRRF